MNKILILLPLLFVFACGDDEPVATGNENNPVAIEVENRWTDDSLVVIRTLEYDRDAMALTRFFKHEDAIYRSEAGLAFASIRDTNYIPQLTELLADPHPKVKMAAAYALGQQKHALAFEPLKTAYEAQPTPDVRKYILEAIGKTGHPDALHYLVHLDTIPEMAVAEGRTWGIYRSLNAGHTSDEGTSVMVMALMSESAEERFVAAHYLGRLRGFFIDDHAVRVLASMEADQEVEVRMMLARALGKIDPEKNNDVLEMMLRLLEGYEDPRVTVNAIHGAYQWDNERVAEAISNLLESPDLQVAVKASEFLIRDDHIEPEQLFLKAQEAGHLRVKANLYRAAVKRKPNNEEWVEEIKRHFRIANNPYEQGALLVALSEVPSEMKFLGHETLQPHEPVVRSSGMLALVEMRKSDAFQNAQEAWEKKKHGMNYAHGFGFIVKECIASDDVAVIAQAATLLRNETLGFKEQFEGETAFMEEAMTQLKLPEGLETYLELQKTIAYFKGEEAPENELDYKPLDWNLIATIPSLQKVKISTTKGDVIAELFVDDAPASVASFVELIRSDYYNGKYIHRMVPNFVIQDGCPRGDGWGSPDFTIRSEYGPLRYTEGTLGMASAGPDTESSQWFITHSPTPHLDGNYSIFGQVIEGMDIVQQLGVGDEIKSMQLID